MLPERESRPEANRAADVSMATEDSQIVSGTADVPRCTRCKKPLYAEKSVRRGMGPVCCVSQVAA